MTCCGTTRFSRRARGSQRQKRNGNDPGPFARRRVCRRNGDAKAFVPVAMMIGSKERTVPGCVEIAGASVHLRELLVSR